MLQKFQSGMMKNLLVCNKYGETRGPRPHRQQRQDQCSEERGR